MKYIVATALLSVTALCIWRWAAGERVPFELAQESSQTNHTVLVSEPAEQVHGPEETFGKNQQKGHEVEIARVQERMRSVAACVRMQRVKESANALLAQSQSARDDYTRQRVDQSLAMVGDQLEKLNGACDGMDTGAQKGAIYPLLWQAAKLGDHDAAACYVAADFPLNDDQLRPTAIDEYRRNAATLIRDGMERGDWRIAELMEAANDRDGDPHRGRYSWFREISAGNPAIAYGYNRLIRLGASDGYARQLDRALDARRAELSPQQIEDQDAWAKKEYETHFARSPPIEFYVPTCKLFDDRRVFRNIRR